jgi:alpha-galactosidase
MKSMKVKNKIYLLASCTLLAGNMWAQNICISTPQTSLVLNAPTGGELKYLYYGSKLSETDLQNINEAKNCDHTAYPVYGMNCPSETALSVRHADGNMSTQMEIVGVDTDKDAQSTLTTVRLKDKVYPFYINVCYKAYTNVDMIETWTEISHSEKKPVCLTQFASAYLPIRRGNVWLSHLSGSWANEGQLTQEPLQPGMTIIKNKDGALNSHTSHAEVMFSLDGTPQENRGRVIGAALCYTGNYKLRIDTDDSDYHQFYAGINEENSSYTLSKKEIFRTPAVALTYTDEGLSGASRNFHKWGRMYKLAHGNKVRDILLNSWEGVYFDINQQGMDQMMGDIASMGGELFVMDDGWFGDKYPRKNDSSSLGDWVVDKNKLPEGIEGLIRDAKKHGIKFGIWIEPEMANTTSELYEKHPEWILKAPQRDPVLGRGGTQVVLDLANPEVQDFVFKVVDDLMTQHPDLAYIKWDANMPIMNHGSNYLTADNQSHMYIEYHRGFEKVCQRIRAKYPDLIIQACASGGGRANYGYLPYFDEFWVSDNTDALQRVYMQWGTSYFFPAIAMASHISAAPNHQTFRTIPLKYRIDVAMSGRLGMEIQPKNMTDEEKDLCRKAIADYKKIRPIVQLGDIYRLVSPYDHQGVASLMYTSPEKDKAVFYWWKTEHFVNQHLPRVTMAGLDPEKTYRITELNRIDNQPLAFEGKTYSGAYLMKNGLEIPYNHIVDYHKQNDYSSRVLYLEEVK